MPLIDNNIEKRITDLLTDRATRREGFDMLVKHISQPIYWQIRKMVLDHETARDLLQDTFIKVWTHLDQFKGDSKLSTWVFRIAVNETYSYLNKEREKHLSDFTDMEDVMVQNLKADSYFSGDETEKKLQAAILSLPDKQRLVFNLRYYDEMKYEDMSEMLGTTVGALKASYHIAAKKIEALMTADI